MATLLGTTTGVSFGASAESGILINSLSINAQSDKQEVRNASGDVVLVSYYNQRAEISVSGTIAGTTGVAAASVGAALTLANMQSVGGVTTGAVCVNSVTVSVKPDGFKELSVSATRYPGV
jgi:hypothetical protein